MLLLTLTTDKLQIITSAAITLDVHASWVDLSGTTVTPGRTNTAIVTATTTDIVASPGSSTTRNIKTLHCRNKHASLAGDVTVQYFQNSTLIELHKITLNAGEALGYIEGVGFSTLANISALDKKLIVTADVINATLSFADVTGLTAALLSGKHYNFFANLYHVNNASTTGSRFGYNIGAAPTSSIVGTIDTVTPSVTASVHSAGVITARDTAATAQTTGSTSQRLAILSGWVRPSANGIFAIRCASEVAVAAGVTVRAGSWCKIWEATG